MSSDISAEIDLQGRARSDFYAYGPPVSDPEPTEDDVEAILKRAAVDRAYFLEHCFDTNPKLEPWQRTVCHALDGGETRVSVRSGHGVGKTFLAAGLAIHFLLFRRNTKIPVTAPSGSQMKDGLGPETKLWLSRLKYGLKDMVSVGSARIALAEDPDNNFISFRTARLENPEALQGIHAKNVLVIADEASGIPEPVFEAARGTMSTEAAIFLLIGNPTKSKGLFYRTHTTLKDLWWTLQVACMDSSMVAPAFIEEMRRTYGEYSNQWRIRVLGEFPEGDDDSIIPRELAEGALDRDVEPVPEAQPIWGVDPGRGGDPTGFIERFANVVTEAKELHYGDSMKVVAWVKQRWDAAPVKPSLICVDSIGMGGPIADRLRELGLPVMDVNVSEASAIKDRFPRLRPELWWSTRVWLERKNVKFDIPREYALKLVEELVAPDLVITSAGKTDVESKASMKSRGVPSPNLADALGLTFALDGGVVAGSQGANAWHVRPWDKPVERGLRGIF